MIKINDGIIPFSVECFLCVEKRGNIPSCSNMNATYNHEEKKEILAQLGISVEELKEANKYWFLEKPCRR